MQMNNLNQATRVLVQRLRGRLVRCSLATSSGSDLNSTSSRPDSHTSQPQDEIIKDQRNSTKKMDSEMDLRSFRESYRNSGLRFSVNRERLVSNFYDFSKAVLDSEATVEKLMGTQTFYELQAQVELYIDFMSNAQIVNLLASAIKLKIDPSTTLVKLLEHEVKFRMTSLTINQANKLLKFYETVELSSERLHIAQMLSYRLRAAIQSNDFGLGNLVEVLDLIATAQLPRSYLPLVEERILLVLTANNPKIGDDDIVSDYLSKKLFDYDTLCALFTKLAQNQRRPKLILRAAANELCKVNLPKSNSDRNALVDSIMSAFTAVANFNYLNRSLIVKLSGDLAKCIDLNALDSNAMCNILRSTGNLKWRHPELLNQFFNHFYENRSEPRIDYNAVITLLHVTALLNFKPSLDLKEFFDKVMWGDRETSIDKSSRKWLGYVWSLAALDLCNEAHLKSVINQDFINSNAERMTYSDKVRLLNLIAIARFEFKLQDPSYDDLLLRLQATTNKGNNMRRLSGKIYDVLCGLATDPDRIERDSLTPYGFSVDYEIMLNEDLDIIPWKGPSLESLFRETPCINPLSQSEHRCALVLLPFNETITNNLNEPVGYKNILVRLLEHVGCKTVFLPEPVIDREKTSADLTNRVLTIIKTYLQGSDGADRQPKADETGDRGDA